MSLFKTQRSIFIVVTRGFIVRNILREGVLNELKKKASNVYIIFPTYGKTIPQYLRDEFEDSNVTLLGVDEPKRSAPYQKMYKLFTKLTSQLVFTITTWKYSQVGKSSKLERSIIWAYIERLCYGVLSKIHLLKKISRWIEQHVFNDCYYGELFEKYKPDVVFATSIMSKLDIQFIKEAKLRGIKTVSMPKGWDNVAKLLYRVVPDRLVLHNTTMKFHAIHDQRIPEEQIVVTGFPQFDRYANTSFLLTREAYCRRIGFNPMRKILFFGSEGSWSPQDDSIVKTLISYVSDSSILGEEVSLIIRPHFSDIKTTRFNRFSNIPNVWVDDSISISDFFWDNWDPARAETDLFINAISHSAMVISIASTLALDACALKKPVVGIGYGALFHPITGIDITAKIYESDHYRSVLETGAVSFVTNENELKRSIKTYLVKPDTQSKERASLVEKLCFKIDGQASKRLAEVILTV